MNENWKHLITIKDGQYCGLDGINIWDYQWKSDYETILVKEPISGDEKSFHRYWIEVDSREIEFVAGEFYNNIFGIYTRGNADPNESDLNNKKFKIAKKIIHKSDLLNRINVGGIVNDYDFLTNQILSDVLIGKGNKEISKNAFELLTNILGKEKIEINISDFDLLMNNI
jgi:hypothetical protein